MNWIIRLLFIGWLWVLVAKILGNIEWSWWIVLIPLWLPAGIFLIFYMIAFGVVIYEVRQYNRAIRAIRTIREHNQKSK